MSAVLGLVLLFLLSVTSPSRVVATTLDCETLSVATLRVGATCVLNGTCTNSYFREMLRVVEPSALGTACSESISESECCVSDGYPTCETSFPPFLDHKCYDSPGCPEGTEATRLNCTSGTCCMGVPRDYVGYVQSMPAWRQQHTRSSHDPECRPHSICGLSVEALFGLRSTGGDVFPLLVHQFIAANYSISCGCAQPPEETKRLAQDSYVYIVQHCDDYPIGPAHEDRHAGILLLSALYNFLGGNMSVPVGTCPAQYNTPRGYVVPSEEDLYEIHAIDALRASKNYKPSTGDIFYARDVYSGATIDWPSIVGWSVIGIGALLAMAGIGLAVYFYRRRRHGRYVKLDSNGHSRIHEQYNFPMQDAPVDE